MGVIDLAPYKPVPATLGDANQVANGFQTLQNWANGNVDNNNFGAGKIFDPAKLMQNAAIDGDPLVWDNTLVKWVPASTLATTRPQPPRVVVGTMAAGPPGSPVDKDIWIATGVDANGTRWHFQFNAGSASAYKWEYIGGGSVYASVDAFETINNNAYVALATAGPSFTLPRAGDYHVSIGATVYAPINAGAGFTAFMSYDVGGAGAADADGISNQNEVNQAVQIGASLARTKLRPGQAASTALVSKYKSTAATNVSFEKRWMTVVPVRIS